jgi:hypothetical protein
VAPEDTAVDAVETTAGHGAAGGAAHMGSGRRWLNRASGGLVGQALGSGDGWRREAAGGGSPRQGRERGRGLRGNELRHAFSSSFNFLVKFQIK